MPAGEHRPGQSLRVAVAVSGGLDSIALLHATWRWARTAGIEVHALHVHHGLQPEADAWMRGVAERCRRWGGIPFHGHRMQGRPSPGDSVEAWARRQRYAALADMARQAGCPLVLLAHHGRDQAETVLLQALRGAGPAGLSAMPRLVQREGLSWARPWLAQPRQRIEAYAQRHRLRAVDDPSNADERLARSRLRRRVWPALVAAFGDAETTLQAVARRAQEARAVLDEVAAADLQRMATGDRLRLQSWLDLSDARRSNVLRHWLSAWLDDGVPETLVRRLVDELPRCAAGSWPAGPAMLRLHRGQLAVVKAGELPDATPPAASPAGLDRPGRHRLPGFDGVLVVRRVRSAGVPAALLSAARVGPRQGGERFQAQARGTPRSLKKQFQAADVPRWCRDGPLIWSGGQLVFVAGLGLDARACGQPGQPRVLLHWCPDRAA